MSAKAARQSGGGGLADAASVFAALGDETRLALVDRLCTGGPMSIARLTEALTRIADAADPVPDEIWDEAARHYDEQGLAALILMIATTNLFNRLNATTRQVAGAKW